MDERQHIEAARDALRAAEKSWAMATSKGYDTGKKSTGSKPPPKATVSLKGTNPMKGKFAATLKREF